MKKVFLCMIASLFASAMGTQAKDLVVYFSAQGHTQAVAEEIADIMNADILRIEPAEPYASNPYDDSDRIQNEAYNDLRPRVANLPDASFVTGYDRIFVGSPIWWHQPAMAVCTFLESYDLTDKTIVPFFTYGATTYLNESMQKIYKVTPNSLHIPEKLPEDLDADDITRPGRPDDSDIDMPDNANGVEEWLKRLGLWRDNSAIETAKVEENPIQIHKNGNMLQIDISDGTTDNSINIYGITGELVGQSKNNSQYLFPLSKGSVYFLSINKGNENKTTILKYYYN